MDYWIYKNIFIILLEKNIVASENTHRLRNKACITYLKYTIHQLQYILRTKW